ncbi:ABC transporter permease subunit [Mycoplasmopsis adleri]|uniref:ABC transporter permease subunit n=1 Tax=Mycoplasmopsis adleri TaxID=51362 RepID=UPI0038735930
MNNSPIKQMNLPKNDFLFASQKRLNANFAGYHSSWSLFWKRFFSNKINYLWLALFLGFMLYLILASTIYKYSPTKPVLDSEIAINLPNYYDANVERTFNPDSPFLKLILETNKKFSNLKIVSNYKQIGDVFLVDYNPYQLIYALSGQKYILLFGTNYQKIDRFSFFNHAMGISVLITLIAISIQLFLGSLLGSILGFYSNKTSSKMSFHLINIINVLPFLIISILLFKIINYSFWNAIWILGLFGSIGFFYTSYANTINIKNAEFITAYKVLGMSNKQIIWKIIMLENCWMNLSLIADNLALDLLVLASLAFFNVKGITSSLNIGNVFQDLINDLSNVSYLLYVIILTSLYVLLSKFLSLALYQAYLVK